MFTEMAEHRNVCSAQTAAQTADGCWCVCAAGVGSSPSSQWDFSGSTLVTSSYVRLTPDERSKQGSIWNTVVRTEAGLESRLGHSSSWLADFLLFFHPLPVQPCHLKDWEMHVQFKVHGSGKKNLHGDGIAIWYTKDRLHPGEISLVVYKDDVTFLHPKLILLECFLKFQVNFSPKLKKKFLILFHWVWLFYCLDLP